MKNIKYSKGGSFLNDRMQKTSYKDKVLQLLEKTIRLKTEDVLELKRLRTLKPNNYATSYKEYIDNLYQTHILNHLTNNQN